MLGVELRENTPGYCRLSPSALKGSSRAGDKGVQERENYPEAQKVKKRTEEKD